MPRFNEYGYDPSGKTHFKAPVTKSAIAPPGAFDPSKRKPGHSDPGPPGEAVWVEKLLPNNKPKFQRSHDDKKSKALIEHMAANLDHIKLGAPICVMTDDGSIETVDGAHRIEAVRLRDDIKMILILLFESRSDADRAASFVGVNKDRKSIHPLELFKARVLSGEPLAISISQLCRECGVSIPHSPVSARDAKPNQCQSIGTLEELQSLFGAPILKQSLSCLRRAFPAKPGQLRAPAIKAISYILSLYGDDVEIDRLIKVLREFEDMKKVEDSARAYREHFGGTSVAAIQATIIKSYNKRLAPENQLQDGGPPPSQ